jgi:glycine dehydrogenase subunit 1
VYLGWLRPKSPEVRRACASKAAHAVERLTGPQALFDDAFFGVPLWLPRPAVEGRDALVKRGYLAGVPLPNADGHALLVAVTEQRTREEIDGLATALRAVLA